MNVLESIRESFAGVDLSAAQQIDHLEEERTLNARRLRVILPMMAMLNLSHIVVWLLIRHFRPDAGTLALQSWAQSIIAIHLVTLLLVLPLIVVVHRMARPSMATGFLGALLYLLHGAVIAGADQLNDGYIAPYLGYCLVIALVVVWRPSQAIVAYAISTCAFVMAMFWMQPDTSARVALLGAGSSIIVPSLGIVFFFYRSRRQAFLFRATIESQQTDLERLNQQLHEELQEKIGSLLTRSNEIELLNRQLQERVRDRSRELSVALRQLGRRRPVENQVAACTTVAGRYRLGEELGRGGMGVVYRAADLNTGQAVAVKFLQQARRPSPETLERFLREVEAASSMDHPAIVKMLHVDVTEHGQLFQVQELVEGQTVEQWGSTVHPFHPPTVLAILAVLADALLDAHRNGIIHRDVKPANIILVPEAPGLKLLDFGVARLERVEDLTRTATGVVLGTPAFMAPELWRSSVEATPAVDVYAFGVTAYRLLTGTLPQPRLTARPVDTLTGCAIDIAPEVRELLDRTLEVEPRARPSMGELATVLRASLDPPPLAERVAAGGAALGKPHPAAADGPSLVTHLTF